MSKSMQSMETDSIMNEAALAAVELDRQQSDQRDNQAAKLERRTTEARRKREEVVKKNIDMKLRGEATRVTPAQARAQQAMVKKLFSAIDTDGDGMLDSNELKALCVGSGIELSAEAHQDFMQQFGSKDGLVSFDDFFKWYGDSSKGVGTHP